MPCNADPKDQGEVNCDQPVIGASVDMFALPQQDWNAPRMHHQRQYYQVADV